MKGGTNGGSNAKSGDDFRADTGDQDGGEGCGRGGDGPAAVWMVLTTSQWAEHNRERAPKDVARLVSQQALHVLCRGGRH